MRILVTGGCGFIGSHLIDRLLLRTDIESLTVVDNLWTGDQENIAHLSDVRLKVVISDIETFSSKKRFDEIYHLASPATPNIYMAEPLRTISSNVVGAFKALSMLAPGGLICFTSTSEVYGDPLVSPQPESFVGAVDCTGPRSSYDESKRCVEAMLFEARRTQGVRVKVARVFNVFGPRTRMDDGRAVSNFISQGLRGMPITILGDGAQTRSWGYVDDILDGLARFFWLDGSDYPGPVNIGNNRELSVLDVARYVQACIPGAEIIHLPPAPQDPSNRCPDLTLAGQVIPGWECRVPYEEGVDRTIAWFKAKLAAEQWLRGARKAV